MSYQISDTFHGVSNRIREAENRTQSEHTLNTLLWSLDLRLRTSETPERLIKREKTLKLPSPEKRYFFGAYQGSPSCLEDLSESAFRSSSEFSPAAYLVLPSLEKLSKV